MRIYVVEDDEGHADIICRNFGARHECTVIRKASEAADRLFQNGSGLHEGPDLILLDLRFDYDKMDGLEFLERIKKSGRQDLLRIPVVILTSSGADPDLKRAYEQHANSYLVKPTEPEDWPKMMAVVEHYWEEWNVT
jgi:CheY-like chemotaxis protein